MEGDNHQRSLDERPYYRKRYRLQGGIFTYGYGKG